MKTNLLDNYSYSLGADISGLFIQSNFGIVSAMTLRLMPKPAAVAITTIEKHPEVPLTNFIDKLRMSTQKFTFIDNLHISNLNRRLSILSTVFAKHKKLSLAEATAIAKSKIAREWAATCSLRGEKSLLDLQIDYIKDFLQEYATINVIYDHEIPNAESAVHGLLKHSLGIPCSDALLSLGFSTQQLLTDSLEASDIGTLFLIPCIPFKGVDIEKTYQCVKTIFHKYNFDLFCTFNLVNYISIEGVINVCFKKTDQISVHKAHKCIQEALSALEDLGFPPMRLSIFQHSKFLRNNLHLQIKNKLKNIFDPDHIIARGKYGID